MGLNPGSNIIFRDRDVSGKTSKRKLAVLIVEAVVALIVVGLIARALWATATPPTQSTYNIPQKIAGFALQKSETGPRAVDVFNRLHGKDVGTGGGWVGYYEGRAIVWAADTSSEAKSQQLVDEMTRRIKGGNDVFGNLDSFREGSDLIYTVTGQGQRHYYFQKGSKVVWIAAPTTAERAFLDDSLRLIN